MLILLPPSEGKAEVGAGRRLDLARLSLPELNPVREQVLAALLRLSEGPAEAALTALGLGAGQHGELGRNARLERAATAPAGRIYTGVLYEALDLATLPPAAHRAAARQVLISSGLWGRYGSATGFRRTAARSGPGCPGSVPCRRSGDRCWGRR